MKVNYINYSGVRHVQKTKIWI